MAIGEVFKNPTVKQVIFQIKFPNLFGIERLIGDYQTSIMVEFPESQLLYSRNILLADLKPGAQLPEVSEEFSNVAVKKIWNFKNPNGVELNVNTDSVDMTSSLHKAYNHKDAPYKFRDIIKSSIDNFLQIVKIPKITRIGLRYIDECPIQNDSHFFNEWYNSTFPLVRFPLEKAQELSFSARIKRDPCFLKFSESFQNDGNLLKYILDVDAYSMNVPSDKYLEVTDVLHEMILSEYDASIREPLKSFMRKDKTVSKAK